MEIKILAFFGLWEKKNAPVPLTWDESKTLRGATQIQEVIHLSSLFSCYGERAVDVSVPALPLSFTQRAGDALSGASLSVRRAVGLLLRLQHGKAIVCRFPPKVKVIRGNFSLRG